MVDFGEACGNILEFNSFINMAISTRSRSKSPARSRQTKVTTTPARKSVSRTDKKEAPKASVPKASEPKAPASPAAQDAAPTVSCFLSTDETRHLWL